MECGGETQEEAVLEIDPSELSTLELDADTWVPYIDLYDLQFIPTRLKIVDEEYAFQSSIISFGSSATLPGTIRELRGAGKKPVIVERKDRYYVFVTPP